MKKFTLLFLMMGLIMTSCKKTNSEDEIDDNQDLTGLIKSINMGGTPILEFSYYGNGRIKTKTIHQQGAQMTIAYEYSDNKLSSQTEKYNGSTVAQYTFAYNNNRLTRVTIVGANNSYWEMQYDNDGKIILAIEYISGGQSIKHAFTYNNDNLIEAFKYNRFGSTWELQSHMEFAYDNKHNPFFDLNLPYSEVLDEFAGLVSPNNFTRVKKYDQNNILTEDTQYDMTYNAEGYPTHVVENSQDSYDYIYY